MSKRAALRRKLAGDGVLLVPGVTNVFDARLAEQAGFEAIFTTGAGIANVTLGYPDLGLATMSEILQVNKRVIEGVSVPVISDADTGYGNHLNVTRTIVEFEQAGAAAVIIEDQVSPKRCGHFEGKAVVGVDEMVENIVAARMARTDPDLVLVARTDSIAVEGFPEALERAGVYVEAGADVIFVEAPRTMEELAAIPKEVAAPCLVNLVEGGRTPLLPAAELERLGFKIVLYANLALRMAARAVERGFRVLREHGTSADVIGEMFSWEERQQTVGLPAWERLDEAIAAEARQVLDGRATGDRRAVR